MQNKKTSQQNTDNPYETIAGNIAAPEAVYLTGKSVPADRATAKRRRRKWPIVLSAVAVMLLLLIATGPTLLARGIYRANFGSRYDTISWMARNVDEFDKLAVQRSDFVSDQGQKLAGYLYTAETPADAVSGPRGIVILAHGLGGGGHNGYMDVAHRMTKAGYDVFAYDATGNDASEGESVGGLPQGIIDLDYALRHVKANLADANTPLLLFGHSWGAYSAGSVLSLHPDVRAVVLAAGFNRSADIIEEEGRRMAGDGIQMVLPAIAGIEKSRFGSYASLCCEDGFAATDAGVMMIHSADDEMISCEKQFDRFQAMYGEDPRFRFVRYEDRGHDYVYRSEAARAYRDDLNQDFAAYAESLDGELTAEIKAAWMDEHLDKSALNELDEDLMQKIVDFYDSHIG